MTIRTQSATSTGNDSKQNEDGFNWTDIEKLIRGTAAREHVRFVHSYYNAFDKGRRNAELFRSSNALGGSSNKNQNKYYFMFAPLAHVRTHTHARTHAFTRTCALHAES